MRVAVSVIALMLAWPAAAQEPIHLDVDSRSGDDPACYRVVPNPDEDILDPSAGAEAAPLVIEVWPQSCAQVRADSAETPDVQHAGSQFFDDPADAERELRRRMTVDRNEHGAGRVVGGAVRPVIIGL